MTATATVLGSDPGGDNASGHPKYGTYACYYDEDSYIQGRIDPPTARS